MLFWHLRTFCFRGVYASLLRPACVLSAREASGAWHCLQVTWTLWQSCRRGWAFLAGPSTPLAQESDRKREVPGGWEGEACEPTGSVACADWNSEGKGAPGPGKAVVSRHGSVRAGGHCGHGHHLQALAGLGALLTWEGMPPSPHPCSSPSPGEPRGFLTWVGSSHLGQEEG